MDQVTDLIKRVVKDSLVEIMQSNPAMQYIPGAQVQPSDTATPGPSADRAGPARDLPPAVGDRGDSDDSLDESDPSGFNFGLVQPFVAAVKQAIGWEEAEEPPKKNKSFFPFLKKKQNFFPFLEELKDLVEGEWKRTDKRFSVNKLQKLYPLAESDASLLDTPPIVDAAVVRLAKNVTLPMEDSTSFKDPLDRRIDADLRKTYQLAGGACRPAIALASVSSAVKVWTENIEVAIREDVPKEDIIKALDELKLSADFIGEAAIDSMRYSARAMLHAVMAKRALWLKPWAADAASKQNWCKIPYDGKTLFGEKLEKAISRVTGGKSGLLPQDRRVRRSRVVSSKFQWSRNKNFNNFRQNRDSKKNWRSTQATFLKVNKQRSLPGAPEGTKSF